MHVAIIGLGLSGSGVLTKLIHATPTDRPLKIDIFEQPEHLGNGTPYAADDDILLMNSTPEDLSMDPEHPLDFVDWIKANAPEYLESHTFMPRPLFGKYLHEKITPYLDDPRVTLIPNEVTKVLPYNAKQTAVAHGQIDKPYTYKVITSDGEHHGAYNACFLGIGHPTYADYYHLQGHPHYIHNPYPVNEKLIHLDQSKKIGIIGSGLSSVDIMRFLHSYYQKEWQHPVAFYIRDLPFTVVRHPGLNHDNPFSLSKGWIKEQQNQNEGFLPLDTLISQIKTDFIAGNLNWEGLNKRYGKGTVAEIRQEVQHNDAMLAQLQGYFDRMKPLLADINLALTRFDKQRLKQTYLPKFEHFRNQLAAPAIREIIDWLNSGKIQMISGLNNIQAKADGFTLLFKDKDPIDVDILINTTGFEKNIEKASKTNPLLKQLYDDQMLTPGDNNTFIKVTWPESQLYSQRFGVQDHLYLLGYWIFSTQFGNNNAKVSFHSGEKVAEHFLNTFNNN